MEPGLYLAATPIGNLGDITLRVLETLAGCDLVACEDTRVTGKLLNHFAIRKKMVAYHEHNANTAGPALVKDLEAGKSVVLVSDAGTPIVSDPGFRLVELVRAADIPVTPLPGASAPLAALVASGLASETWTFCGFLPSKQGAREKRLRALANLPSTLIFFESPNRLTKSLDAMSEVFGTTRRACVARELTKLHEEIATGTIGELQERFADRTIKGEIVILIEPDGEDAAHDLPALMRELLETMPTNKAASEAASMTGLPKRDLYQIALSIKAETAGKKP